MDVALDPAPAAAAVAAPASADAFVLDGVSRSHGAVLANDGIDLRIAQGEVFGLLGPNGAGKTTLIRQLVALSRPDRGRITLFGAPLTRQLAGRAVAYLPQSDSAMADLPVGLAVATTARLRGCSRSGAHRVRDEVLAELGLTALADRPLGRLSGGQRRLGAVATALAGERPVLLLDEPTTGLDPTARRAVWAALARRRSEFGATVVLVTHNVLEAETVLDRVAVLEAGRVIVCDTPGGLKARVDSSVRLELVWRHEPPLEDPAVGRLAALASISGRRWSLRLPAEEARVALGQLTTGPAFAALDDFTLATPSLEDVYLSLGGTARDMEHE